MAVVGGCKPVPVACVLLCAFCNHLVRLLRDLFHTLHLPIIISHHLVIILLPWHLFTILWPSGQHLLWLILYTILHIVVIYFRLFNTAFMVLFACFVCWGGGGGVMCELTLQFPIMGWLKYSVFGEHFVYIIEGKKFWLGNFYIYLYCKGIALHIFTGCERIKTFLQKNTP